MWPVAGTRTFRRTGFSVMPDARETAVICSNRNLITAAAGVQRRSDYYQCWIKGSVGLTSRAKRLFGVVASRCRALGHERAIDRNLESKSRFMKTGRFRLVWAAQNASARMFGAGVDLALLGGCVGSEGDPASGAARENQPADELMVVDCLLPPQVRQLGRHASFLSARRPIKTTASDCAIRGGEYTAFDRADYATALKTWLPVAQEGDPEAQTYVGEIYEKGLGLKPDYEAAIIWYRKAAEAGFTRAQINLGNLYEKGLGVEQNAVEALNWYRR